MSVIVTYHNLHVMCTVSLKLEFWVNVLLIDQNFRIFNWSILMIQYTYIKVVACYYDTRIFSDLFKKKSQSRNRAPMDFRP